MYTYRNMASATSLTLRALFSRAASKTALDKPAHVLAGLTPAAKALAATVAARAASGITLLVLQPIAADGTDIGRTLVAVDAMGAGAGERVFFVRGKEASFPFYPTEVPADAGVVGIVDHWDLG